VICGFFAARAGNLLPPEPRNRVSQARWEALGDGMTDILLLWRIERMREEKGDPAICAAFEAKIRATVAWLEGEAPALAAAPLGIGQIAIFCALGQLEFRWPGTGWREAFPNLAAWFAGLETHPAFAATAVVDDAPAAAAPGSAQPTFTFEKS
jgi:glutathione S-transferase